MVKYPTGSVMPLRAAQCREHHIAGSVFTTLHGIGLGDQWQAEQGAPQ